MDQHKQGYLDGQWVALSEGIPGAGPRLVSGHHVLQVSTYILLGEACFYCHQASAKE